MLDNDEDPFTEWDDLKFTVGGILALLSPLFLIFLLAVFLADWLN